MSLPDSCLEMGRTAHSWERSFANEYLFCSSSFANDLIPASGSSFANDLIPASGSSFANDLIPASGSSFATDLRLSISQLPVPLGETHRQTVDDVNIIDIEVNSDINQPSTSNQASQSTPRIQPAGHRLRVEKDPQDTSQKTRESHDTSQKVLELQKKLDQARNQLRRLRGVEYNKEEQLDKLATLRKQLQLKKELLQKYRHMCSFDIPK
uniref:Mediator of RNA polymerase II transcription subunit 9 n=1 Tax=Timema genevievae TaxID=629358 RepID=A0A7R9PIT9_TIMGE|nr:unnamed protein product [Timema genevievae]